MIEFLAGVALFRLRLRIPQILGLAAAFGVVANFVPPLPDYQNHLFWHLTYFQLTVIIGGAALIGSLVHDGWLSRALSNNPLILGGEISYSIYMCHQPLMILLLPHFAVFALPVQFALICGAVLGASFLLFYQLKGRHGTPSRAGSRHRRLLYQREAVGTPAISTATRSVQRHSEVFIRSILRQYSRLMSRREP